ncbi:hypothetical protein EPA86_09255 [Litorilituus lipolyticus]|uniref:Uncharacterized protein n=2 Tax=Litorilituus lipolyticus TaxID=2491017 RepID=A0A502KVQ7_9GAMM|nr:hypothetical protein EPA86_09255 [Litorilituus lipolyticus]
MNKYTITHYFQDIPPNQWQDCICHRYETEYYGGNTPENIAFNNQMEEFDEFCKSNNIEIEDYFPLIEIKPVIKALGVLCQSINLPNADFTIVDFLKSIYEQLPTQAIAEDGFTIILDTSPVYHFTSDPINMTYLTVNISGIGFNHIPSKNAYQASVCLKNKETDESITLINIVRDI